MCAFFDRISCRTVAALPDLVLPGQWWIDPPGDNPGIATGSYVVPDLRGRCVREGDLSVVGGTCLPDLMPASILMEGLRNVAETISLAETWEDFFGVPPLSAAKKRGAIQPLDQLIARRLGVLEEICRAPRSQLDLLNERVPVARARRLPPSAPQHLAVHVEDWEFPTLVGVYPKRLLSSVAEDRLNIYENQVVARLIDGLLDYLRRRIADVERLLVSYEETEQYASQADQGTFWKQRRVYELWGEHLNAAAEIFRAKAVLARLHQLRRRLLALMDSPLYQSVPSQIRVPGTLKLTNIFVNDTLYRFIAHLWLQWSRIEVKTKPSSNELVQSRQQLCRDFDQYTRLLVLRALSEFGFKPTGSAINTSVVELTGTSGTIAVNFQADGALILSLKGPYKKIRIVPVAVAFAELRPERLESVLDVAMAGLKPNEAESLLVLYVGTNPPSTLPLDMQRRLACAYVPTRLKIPPMMPVSPLSIESVERVARAMRWWIAGQQYLRCPYSISRPAAIDSHIGPPAEWLRAEGKSFEMIRPPTTTEKKQFGAWMRAARRPARMATARADDESLRQFELAVSEAGVTLMALSVCPTCHEHVEPEKCLHYESSQFWQLRCPECETRWGVQRCPHADCGRRYPVIILSATGVRTSTSPLWVNSALGRDVLAEPCCAGGGAFICPFCGKCPDVDATGSCPACSAHACLIQNA